jgi:hypothetical protein
MIFGIERSEEKFTRIDICVLKNKTARLVSIDAKAIHNIIMISPVLHSTAIP